MTGIMAAFGAQTNNPTVAGLIQSTYDNVYFNDNVNYFSSATPTSTSIDTTAITAFDNSSFASSSHQWLGYWYVQTSGNYNFSLNSTDSTYFWIGPNAVSGYTALNATISNPGVHSLEYVTSPTQALTGGLYYPVRIQWGYYYLTNYSGNFNLYWQSDSQSLTTNVTGRVFNRPGSGL